MVISMMTVIAFALIFLGFIGTIVPVLPGTVLIFVGALLYWWGVGFAAPAVVTLWWLGGLMVASLVVDYLGGVYGAKRFGASRAGVWGGVVGALVGIVIPPPLVGIVIGTFVGTVVAELVWGDADHAKALRSGAGSALGFLGGTLIKVIIALVMIALFFRGII